MNIEELRSYCLTKKGATESFPFGEQTLVFKVGDKIFLLTGLDSHPMSFNAKCDPEEAINLREQYPNSVFPGYHMNKKHWNTVVLNREITLDQAKRMIDHSYELIFNSLPLKIRDNI
ncbi:MmcQ/YjbR family DNA-binding protein [Albibacterium bauzanense]|uniref:Putative DNA-binding protein (MmcQ/YjbR family) n=1 Tax=Albibacterium bauzanense TaxID=653929 RepID=A0A4R1M2M1_9SPHI|nr:MmcQ/YjbR family DNA-binding protein [Albibacterium bauzanense]TCK85462.1 putative DNA-binding protein (MmcQ/YjbR family) [Albibacterium bauzanense]